MSRKDSADKSLEKAKNNFFFHLENYIRQKKKDNSERVVMHHVMMNIAAREVCQIIWQDKVTHLAWHLGVTWETPDIIKDVDELKWEGESWN